MSNEIKIEMKPMECPAFVVDELERLHRLVAESDSEDIQNRAMKLIENIHKGLFLARYVIADDILQKTGGSNDL